MKTLLLLFLTISIANASENYYGNYVGQTLDGYDCYLSITKYQDEETISLNGGVNKHIISQKTESNLVADVEGTNELIVVVLDENKKPQKYSTTEDKNSCLNLVEITLERH